jgi:hypothetical protein
MHDDLVAFKPKSFAVANPAAGIDPAALDKVVAVDFGRLR